MRYTKSMPTYPVTPLTKLNRTPTRGTYDATVVHAILDEALVCHLGFEQGGQPFVVPTAFARIGETLYVHGAAASRMLRAAAADVRVCITVTLLDGLVFSRSWFHHSMNYRSVILLGSARDVTSDEEKTLALAAVVDRVSPQRSRHARPPTSKELAATRVLAVPLLEVSAKVREGGPVEDAADDDPHVYSGHVPLCMAAEMPDARIALSAPIPPLPAAVRRLTA